MVLKTFNVSQDVYEKFSGYCKDLGISMSRQVDLFMRAQIEEEPAAKKAYLEKLESIRKEKFLKVSSFADQYGL